MHSLLSSKIYLHEGKQETTLLIAFCYFILKLLLNVVKCIFYIAMKLKYRTFDVNLEVLGFSRDVFEYITVPCLFVFVKIEFPCVMLKIFA